MGVGLFQSLILGTVLLIYPGADKYISKLTGVTLLFTSLIIASELFDLYDYEQVFGGLLEITILVDLLLIVLIWWISLFILGKKDRFYKRDFWHLLPFIIGLIWINSTLGGEATSEPGTFSHISDVIGLFVAYKTLIWVIYMGSSIIIYFSYRFNETSLAYYTKRTFFNRLVWPFVIISFISFFSFWLMFFGIRLPLDSDYIAVILTVGFVYYLSFSILYEPGLFLVIRTRSRFFKYRKSTLPPEQSIVLQDQLLQLLEKEKPFLDHKLSLPELAQKLRISPNLLSQLINERLGKSFHGLLNEYRLREVKSKLRDSHEDKKTLLALAFEAGFQSKASFNRIFKQSEGLTPSEYKRKYRSQPTF